MYMYVTLKYCGTVLYCVYTVVSRTVRTDLFSLSHLWVQAEVRTVRYQVTAETLYTWTGSYASGTGTTKHKILLHSNYQRKVLLVIPGYALYAKCTVHYSRCSVYISIYGHYRWSLSSLRSETTRKRAFSSSPWLTTESMSSALNN